MKTVIITFDLPTQQHFMFQALLQAEDGLALVRCIDGEQQLWCTEPQELELYQWLKDLPQTLNFCMLRRDVWQEPTATVGS